MTPYQNLIQRVESGEVSRELDAAIADAVLGPVKPPYRRGHCEKYTSSLDAAMTLVPEGFGLTVSRYWISSKDGPVWMAELATGGTPDRPRQIFDSYDLDVAAAAIVAACLRAKQALIEEERG